MCIDSERTAGIVSAACVCEICAAHSYRGLYCIKKVMLLTFFYNGCKKHTCCRSSYLGTNLGSWHVSLSQSYKGHTNKGP